MLVINLDEKKLYEFDEKMLFKIKELLPDCYICNLDGKVIA